MKTRTKIALGVAAASAVACSAALYFKFRCPYDFESENTRKRALHIIAYEMGLYDICIAMNSETGDAKFWLVPDRKHPYALGEKFYCQPETRDRVLSEMDTEEPFGTITEDEVKARWIKLIEEVGDYRDKIWKDLKNFKPPEIKPVDNPNLIHFNPGIRKRRGA